MSSVDTRLKKATFSDSLFFTQFLLSEHSVITGLIHKILLFPKSCKALQKKGDVLSPISAALGVP